MNNQTVAFIAIVAVVALVFTAAIVTQDADARRRHHNNNSVHQTSAQACVNENARCQNVNSQNSGHDIGSVTIGNQL
jgi:hypothetical protein